mgnify:CR=1 FL=1
MKTSERGINLIQHFEGFYNKPYYCPAGVLTIGYGTVIQDPTPYMNGITKEQATELMMKEVVRNEKSIGRLIVAPLNQNQFDALISFVYNLGAGNLQISTLRRKINSLDYAGAANEFLKWCKAGGRVLPGLVRRRKVEAELFMT